MSGLALPLEADGVCRNVEFVDCTFHPNCGDVQFENCKFTNCWGVHYLMKQTEAAT